MSEPPSGERPLFLLDGMSLAFRAYFALPADLATRDGTVTNALHGFVSMLVNLVRDHRPSSLAVAFDLPGGTFRDELVPDYKGGRAETPEDLLPQFEMVREVLGSLAVPVVEAPGYEADDVLATLATEARDRHCPVVVVTGDRDCFQLVEDPYVRVLYNRRGVSDYALYDEAGIIERTGVRPESYPMLAALRGDPSDNLPGVPGVGEKTAAKLLGTYGDLAGIFANVGSLSPKLRENLIAHQAVALANARVIPLVRDVPLAVRVEDLQLGGWDLREAEATFGAFELRTLWQRIAPLLEEGALGPPGPGSELPGGPAAVIATGDAAPPAATGDAAPPAAPGDAAPPGSMGDGPPPAPTVATGDPAGAAGGGPLVPTGPPTSLLRPDDAAGAVAAIAERVAAVDGGVLAVAGRWEGTAGRAPLSGVALVAGDGGVWVAGSVLAEDAGRRALGEALAAAPVAGHQVKELFRSLLPMGVDCTGLVMDTAVAAYLLDPSTGDYSLESVAGAPLAGAAPVGTPPGAAPVGTPPGQLALGAGSEDVGARAATEAATIARLVAPLRLRLEEDGLLSLHDEVECPLVRVLARMEVAGIGVDTGELRRIADELAADVKALESEIHRLVGHPFNVNSTPQLRTVLYDELGLTPGRKTKTGYSTDAATLESLRDAHPVVETLLRYREVEKLRSTYGEALLAEVAADGRIHASFRQTVARTGRLSSDRPNLHNIPVRTEGGRRFRRAFIPAEGFRFLVADYDQVELRVIAHLSGDPGLVEAFRTGADVHRAVASGVYGVPAEEVTRTQRERAKMVSYGLAYGMEAFGLARRLATGVDEANEIMSRYFDAFPQVKRYMEQTVAEARARGFTRTELGRKRPLPELADRNYRVRQAAERQAMNAGIQGLAADLFKAALVRLDGSLESGGLASRLVLQVHDEVIVEVAGGEDDTVAGLTESALIGAAELSVPLRVSMAWGDSWAAAKGG
ncbi:MAG TPA: DNA polymerase I [Acidimicrobiales bacterium]|nr:DNA polymerase I [Acidimicrobiales bacterium]